MLAIREYVQKGGSLEEKEVKRIVITKRHLDTALEAVRSRSREPRGGPSPMVA